MSTRFKTTSAVCLQDEIKKLGSNVKGVELGVWYGYNMGHLLEECPNISMLTGIDPYLPYQDWNRYIGQELMDAAVSSTKQILSEFPDRSSLLIDTSLNIASATIDNTLDFIFIDGDHSYERCFEDLNAWYSKIRPGGLFSGHDFSLPGVNKALLDFRTQNNIKGFFKVIPNDVWYWIKD